MYKSSIVKVNKSHQLSLTPTSQLVVTLEQPCSFWLLRPCCPHSCCLEARSPRWVSLMPACMVFTIMCRGLMIRYTLGMALVWSYCSRRTVQVPLGWRSGNRLFQLGVSWIESAESWHHCLTVSFWEGYLVSVQVSYRNGDADTSFWQPLFLSFFPIMPVFSTF